MRWQAGMGLFTHRSGGNTATNPRTLAHQRVSLALQTTDESGQVLRNAFVQYGRVETPQHLADRIDHHARVGARDAR